ncbi:MAG: MalY/PatB family protein [Pseudomonadota bacterium]
MPLDPTFFDEMIDRRGTDCSKWDAMEAIYGVPTADGIAMWVADMDFRSPEGVNRAVAEMAEHGLYGYGYDDAGYRESIRWWMETRHGWSPDPAHIFTTHGLVNGTALCVDAFTAPGDGIVLFTPVYHAFFRVIRAAGREVTECEMVEVNGRHTLDFDAYDAAMTGREKMVILCSPHNPGGRVWTRDELEGVAAFARRHDLIIVSDEIHEDLVYPGATHLPFALVDGVADRLVMLTAASKTFNIAGSHVGNVTIEDDALRARFAARMAGLGMSPNTFGPRMVQAAYSPEGAEWVDALVAYLDENRRLFDAGIAAIPGLRSVALESTYLAWVDFAGTGMEADEFTRRVSTEARIAANKGTTFGKGGDSFLRFNFATPRPRVLEALTRLADAFGDLQ